MVCDSSKIDERGCNGAPDLIIEILSPSNTRKERFKKFNLYLEAKVREYWIVSPENQEIIVHVLDKDRYFTRYYGVNHPDTEEEELAPEIISASVLQGLEINLKEIFYIS